MIILWAGDRSLTLTLACLNKLLQAKFSRPFYAGGCIKQTTKYVNVSLETFKSVGIGEYL